MVRVVGAKILHADPLPSDEEFRLVVESSCDSAASPARATLSAYRYFENARNFLVAVEQMGLHTFEASDLEQASV
ncbi:putative minus-end-directed kinesin ATPase [Helianthus anomalus]